jgi:electron transfer flavoprotein beta subunit
MNYLVCIKRVPKFPNKVKIDPETNNLDRSGVRSVINACDLNALTMALELKKQTGGTVTTLTMGSPGAVSTVKECIAMGADAGYLVSDGGFRGADTLATSYTLAMAAKYIGDFDVVITGAQTSDGDTGQVGPELAERLGMNQASYVKKVLFKDDKFVALRSLYNGTEKISIKSPCLFTVVKDANEPVKLRKSKLDQVKDEDVVVLSAEDIGADLNKTGAKGSATDVVSIFEDDDKAKGTFLEGDLDQQTDKLLDIFKELKLI